MYREGLSFYKNDKVNYTYTFPFATPTSYESTIYYGGFIWETCPNCGEGDVIIYLSQKCSERQLPVPKQIVLLIASSNLEQTIPIPFMFR
jgi:hypothetical protein